MHQRIMRDYRYFVQSFIHIADDRVRTYVDEQLEKEQQLWPEPLVQLSPAYRRADDVDQLAARGLLHPTTAAIFRRSRHEPISLYLHQVEAIERARAGRSYVVTSGTGSGKSFCYFLPIIDEVVRQPQLGGPVAIIVYPMNALVNSQLNALEVLKRGYEERTGQAFPVRFARYTGETKKEDRQRIRRNPPHILLTNYMMLELMMVRPEDRPLVQNKDVRQVPLYLVFDELHTYRGRQGADVAMLIRRLKARLQREKTIHIGTSATMVAHRDATPDDRRKTISEFASVFFGHDIPADDIIEETLDPITQGGSPTEEELREALDSPLPATAEDFCRHPLVRWVEHALGIETEEGGRLRRRVPRTLNEAAAELAELTERSVEECTVHIRKVLLQASQFRDASNRPLFSFKLHQFINQGGTLYATLEEPEARSLAFEQPPPTSESAKIWAPLRFCRICGQDHYQVVLTPDGAFQPAYPDGLDEQEGTFGYLTLDIPDLLDLEEAIPHNWLYNGKLTAIWRNRVPQEVWVRPDGKLSKSPVQGAVKAWWQADKFYLCLGCGENYTARENEYSKLATLSTEGRSSATTILATSLLRHARKAPDVIKPKLLTFTDSRQDAALQAGHFNDFIHVAVLRAALYQALRERGKLRYENLATEVVERMGLQIADIAQGSRLDPDSNMARKIRQTFKELTEYRLLYDLRRGWRVTQPNLEEVGLLRIEYEGLDELLQKKEKLAELPELSRVPLDKRRKVIVGVLDFMRKKLAIDALILTDTRKQGELAKRAETQLNEFWGLDVNGSELRPGAVLVRGKPKRWTEKGTQLRLTWRSRLGRRIKRELDLISEEEFEAFIDRLLDWLVRQGFLREDDGANDVRYYRLAVSCMVWRHGDGKHPAPDWVWSRRTTEVPAPVNRFFLNFYQEMASELAHMEAREHTAQVVAEGERERRERRFRGEEEPPLPYLICSPTMELGIDIADLNAIHMRNVPPTPANYAQRSGRAGRQGQPGLIITYCGAHRPHDAYFFRHREEMVAGSVRAPRLDLTNEALIKSHVQAEWLAEVGLPLGQSISEVIEISAGEHKTNDDYPLKVEVQQQLILSSERKGLLMSRLETIFQFDQQRLDDAGWYTTEWLESILEQAPKNFNKAFERWREMFRAATEEMRRGQKLEYSHVRDEQQQGRRMVEEAKRQRNLLLQQNVEREEGDFYPYRYLATEGFLPGYNFPALPLRAWVPRGEKGEFIARPRFLAIREFAPQNTVYHEGVKWTVVGFQTPPGGLEHRRMRKRICRQCASYTDVSNDVCPVCGVLFDGSNSTILDLMDMPNVRVWRRERINCNEEERLRYGYHIQFTYQLAPEGAHHKRVTKAVVSNYLHLEYAPAASILLVNHGWRRRRDQQGFLVDFQNNDLILKDDRARDVDQRVPASSNVQRVRLCVHYNLNLLRLKLAQTELREDAEFETTLMYALERAIEHAFQIEDAELVVEAVGEGAGRAIMLYETGEGGAGVLRQLVEDGNALREVARQALILMHFDPDSGEDLSEDGHHACYECLLSFANQQKAQFINRYRVRDFLMQLKNAQLEAIYDTYSRSEQYQHLLKSVDPNSELELKFLDHLYQNGYRLPDWAQYHIQEANCVADFFYEDHICVFCDGSVHDRPEQRAKDERIRNDLRSLGYRVVVIRYDQPFDEQIQKYPDVFGHKQSDG